MTASVDITVIPTGGSTPIDLADLAAAVLAMPSPQITFGGGIAYAGGGAAYITIYKATSTIEQITFTIDGSPYTAGLFSGVLPDGSWQDQFLGIPSSPGTHAVVATASATGATVSGSYVI